MEDKEIKTELKEYKDKSGNMTINVVGVKSDDRVILTRAKDKKILANVHLSYILSDSIKIDIPKEYLDDGDEVTIDVYEGSIEYVEQKSSPNVKHKEAPEEVKKEVENDEQL